MKRTFLFILTFTYSVAVLAQHEKKYALDFGDVFVLRIEIKKDVLNGKYLCNKKKSILSEIVVSDVIYCPPNKSFDSTHLLELKYVLFGFQDRKMLNADTSLVITAKPSGSKYYLSFSKDLRISNETEYQFYHPHAYLSELSRCKGKDKFEKYILKQL